MEYEIDVDVGHPGLGADCSGKEELLRSITGSLLYDVDYTAISEGNLTEIFGLSIAHTITSYLPDATYVAYGEQEQDGIKSYVIEVNVRPKA